MCKARGVQRLCTRVYVLVTWKPCANGNLLISTLNLRDISTTEKEDHVQYFTLASGSTLMMSMSHIYICWRACLFSEHYRNSSQEAALTPLQCPLRATTLCWVFSKLSSCRKSELKTAFGWSLAGS